MSKKKSSFWSDFKAFISRGNVVDMAVGVVIGGAFGKIVTGLVDYIINPLCGLFIKDGALDNFKTVLKEATVDAAGNEVAEVALKWGSWIQTIIDFVIVALCIFLILRVIMKAREKIDAKKKAEEEAAAAKAAEEKAAADAAAAEAAAVAAARQAAVEDAILNQEKLLKELVAASKK
ncbi:MAG: large conductance mechanosensitive channel protein MscL [Clostridia bacterium]|nr:large conductance mechanosensitive channel protein MscL [Clostridia bacterium]